MSGALDRSIDAVPRAKATNSLEGAVGRAVSFTLPGPIADAPDAGRLFARVFVAGVFDVSRTDRISKPASSSFAAVSSASAFVGLEITTLHFSVPSLVTRVCSLIRSEERRV